MNDTNDDDPFEKIRRRKEVVEAEEARVAREREEQREAHRAATANATRLWEAARNLIKAEIENLRPKLESIGAKLLFSSAEHANNGNLHEWRLQFSKDSKHVREYRARCSPMIESLILHVDLRPISGGGNEEKLQFKLEGFERSNAKAIVDRLMHYAANG